MAAVPLPVPCNAAVMRDRYYLFFQLATMFSVLGGHFVNILKTIDPVREYLFFSRPIENNHHLL